VDRIFKVLRPVRQDGAFLAFEDAPVWSAIRESFIGLPSSPTFANPGSPRLNSVSSVTCPFTPSATGSTGYDLGFPLPALAQLLVAPLQLMTPLPLRT
jgi:hypothetical protein